MRTTSASTGRTCCGLGRQRGEQWYKNDKGRVGWRQNWPFNLIEYWKHDEGAGPGGLRAVVGHPRIRD